MQSWAFRLFFGIFSLKQYRSRTLISWHLKHLGGMYEMPTNWRCLVTFQRLAFLVVLKSIFLMLKIAFGSVCSFVWYVGLKMSLWAAAYTFSCYVCVCFLALADAFRPTVTSFFFTLCRYIGLKMVNKSQKEVNTTGSRENLMGPALFIPPPPPWMMTETIPSWLPTHRYCYLSQILHSDMNSSSSNANSTTAIHIST